MGRFLERLALLVKGVFTGNVQMQTAGDNAIQTQITETSYRSEPLCVFTLAEMRSLLKAASDTSKSAEERKAEVRKLFHVRKRSAV